MPQATVALGVQGGEQFRDLSKRLRAQGRGDLQRNLRRNIKAVSKPVENELRGAVMRVQVTSTRGGTAAPDLASGLRARTARAITTSITQRGIRIKVNAAKVGPYGASLPRYLDASIPGYSRWRHPVFGQPTVWTEQSGSGWFFLTMQRRAPTFQRAVLAAMDDTARELAG